MLCLSNLVAVVATLVAFSRSHDISPCALNVSNAAASLTLLYQNNLNASDDVNHVGAILLDSVPLSAASSACAALNERLLPRSAIQQHKTDFLGVLSYQDYAGYTDADDGYYIENGTVSADTDDQQITFHAASSHGRHLPVLCTQSANNGSSSAGPVSGSLLSVPAGGNTYTGYRNQKSFRFLGIPYANKPTRFEYSSLYSPTGQMISATAYGSQCAQTGTGSEDCLFLNIQTPYIPKAGSRDTDSLRPVLFWIHGGGFTGGTGADPLSDGGDLASREDIVVVTINYRLSTLGFLAIPGTNITGNYGIADQITALDWTIKNIAAFGGDPTQITIMGESAGAGSVRTLLGSPKAIGKFQGAVAMSNLGGGQTLGLSSDYGTTYSKYYTLEQSYAAAGQQIFTAAGCNSSSLDAQIACLRTIDPIQLVGFSTVARYVVQDGVYVNTPHLTVSTRNASTAHIPVIFGNTRDDGASFSTYPPSPISNHSQGLQEALGINATWAQRIISSGLFPLPNTGNLTLDSFNVSARIATDKTFRCVDQATVYAGSQSRAFAKAYYYQMDRTINGYDPNNVGKPADNNPNNPYFRVHGSDMPWLFGTIPTLRDANDLYSVQLTTAYFGAFVKNGDPNPDEDYLQARGYRTVLKSIEESGSWDEIDGSEGPIHYLDYPSSVGEFVDKPQCAWLGYGVDYYLKGGI